MFFCPLAALASSASDEGLAIFQRLRATKYSHDTRIDERCGIYELDCSAFAKLVLDRTNQEASRELVDSSSVRPLARDFVALFDSLLHGGYATAWEGVRYARHLRAGDLISWLIPTASTSRDTGHVMIVTGVPKRSPRLNNEYLVPVVDAAEFGHGHTDPRRKAGANGVGQGVVGIVVDKNDQPTGFYWSGGESTALHESEIRFARPR